VGSRQWAEKTGQHLQQWEKVVGVRNYTELFAWQKGIDLVEAVYLLSARFPREELYGLTSQIRRAAVSVPSNIAEGQGRWTTGEFVQFLGIAHGSLREIETQVHIAVRLKFVGADEAEPVFHLAAEVGRLIHGLKNSLS
jgi:four helix bundle protein